MTTAPTVPRELTQARLDRRAHVGTQFLASSPYTTADRVEESVQRYGQRPCLHFGTQSWTYATFNEGVNQVAHAAHALGVRRGDVVALAMENRPAFFFAWFGLSKLGAVVAFLNTHVSGRALEHALEVTGATTVIVGSECLAHFAATPGLPAGLRLWLWPDAERAADPAHHALCALDLSTQVAQAPTHNPPAEWRAGLVAGDTAQYIFTSGTTGLPKAAVISHARWLMAGAGMQAIWEIVPEDCFYCFLPLYHGAASMSATATALTAGASLALRRKFSRSEFWSDVRRYQITMAQYVGEICRFLLSVPPAADDKNHTLRKMSGTGLTPEIWAQWVERFGEAQIFESWGSTESNTSTLNLDNRIGSCGRVPFWEKTNLRLVRYDIANEVHPRGADGFLQLAEVDEPGEAIGMIYNIPDVVAGRFEGYTSAEATEKKILRNVFAPGDAWWSSGDLLRADADGYCWFVDRIGDTFRWKSENVSTAEVADALGDFAGLDALTIYGVQVPGHEGRAGMAALVLLTGAVFDPAAFWALATARLPRYAAPLFVRLSATADMTGNYKLRKVDLQREGFDASLVQDPLFVRDDAARTYVPLNPQALAKALGG
ncbi:long-chain-acyl-CoA synthetase [Rhodoferax lacus]|uniref:Long-chain-acyl-CoA synthetase n=1 Tax=Rhodoferax lacus TaxID=2184758 RepID=A0A3E1R9F9_9BURK|nr:long-chain-acyl-CoA synthetase [Rhodoferax lacus]RFO96006.1 long-chain-acyl-CoA synthetase [Rhodoferax lacus]